jgi:hypothetical protein
MTGIVIGRPCGQPVIRWKYPPQAWWPELSGKDLTRPYPPVAVAAMKRMCKECRSVEVKGIRRYCAACSKNRKRASTRLSLANSRSRVRKTGFSPIGAEALTHEL